MSNEMNGVGDASRDTTFHSERIATTVLSSESRTGFSIVPKTPLQLPHQTHHQSSSLHFEKVVVHPGLFQRHPGFDLHPPCASCLVDLNHEST
jgi:hypothetical protein